MSTEKRRFLCIERTRSFQIEQLSEDTIVLEVQISVRSINETQVEPEIGSIKMNFREQITFLGYVAVESKDNLQLKMRTNYNPKLVPVTLKSESIQLKGRHISELNSFPNRFGEVLLADLQYLDQDGNVLPIDTRFC